MARATFPLATLLRLREEICRQREQGLATAVRALAHAERALEQARRDQAGHHELLDHARGRALESVPGAAARLQTARRYLDRLEAELRRLSLAVEEAAHRHEARAQEVEEARGGLAAAEAELKVVEKNREAWDDKRHKEALARAEAELEDLIAARKSGQGQ